MVEIHRRVAALAGRIDIDHLDVFADRAGCELIFPARIQSRLVDAQRLDAARKRRIVGVDAQRPARRLFQRVGRSRAGDADAPSQLPARHVDEGYRHARLTARALAAAPRAASCQRIRDLAADARHRRDPPRTSAGPAGRRPRSRKSARVAALRAPACAAAASGAARHPGEDAQDRKRGRIRPLLSQHCRGGCNSRHRLLRAQLPAPEVLDRPRIGRMRRAVEQRLTDRLDPHPRLADRHRRRRGSSASTAPPPQRSAAWRRTFPAPSKLDDLAAAETRPRHVRRRSGDGGAHLAVRAVIAGHHGQTEIGIGLVIRHHAAGRDYAVEAGGIDDVAGRQVAEVVAGRGDDEDALLVQRIHRVGPCLRC